MKDLYRLRLRLLTISLSSYSSFFAIKIFTLESMSRSLSIAEQVLRYARYVLRKKKKTTKRRVVVRAVGCLFIRMGHSLFSVEQRLYCRWCCWWPCSIFRSYSFHSVVFFLSPMLFYFISNFLYQFDSSLHCNSSMQYQILINFIHCILDSAAEFACKYFNFVRILQFKKMC